MVTKKTTGWRKDLILWWFGSDGHWDVDMEPLSFAFPSAREKRIEVEYNYRYRGGLSPEGPDDWRRENTWKVYVTNEMSDEKFTQCVAYYTDKYSRILFGFAGLEDAMTFIRELYDSEVQRLIEHPLEEVSQWSREYEKLKGEEHDN